MRDATDIGPFFIQPIKLKRWSVPIRRGDTQETEPPFRTANSWVIHVFGISWGIVVGKWRSTGYSEEQAAERVDIIVGLRKAEEFDTADMADWVKEHEITQELVDGRVLY